MSITTLKLFETMLTKPNEHIMNNLVLRNLLGRGYVAIETADSGHHSPTPEEQQQSNHQDNSQNNTNPVGSSQNNQPREEGEKGEGHGNKGEGHVGSVEQANSSQSTNSDANIENSVSSTEQKSVSEEQQDAEKSSELLTNGATATTSETASSEAKSSPSDIKTSDGNDQGDSENKVDDPSAKEATNNSKVSEQCVDSEGHGEPRRQRHHSDFENELDEILGRVSSPSGKGDAATNAAVSRSSEAMSSSQSPGQEKKLVNNYGKH